MERHDSTSSNIVECNMLNLFGHHVAWCMMLNEVWFPSNISCNIVQHFCSRVWTTKLHSFGRVLQHCCTRAFAASNLSEPKIRDHYSSQISNFHNSSLHRTTCCICLATQSNTIQQSWTQRWMMLHTFGQGFNKTYIYIYVCIYIYIVWAVIFRPRV